MSITLWRGSFRHKPYKPATRHNSFGPQTSRKHGLNPDADIVFLSIKRLYALRFRVLGFCSGQTPINSQTLHPKLETLKPKIPVLGHDPPSGGKTHLVPMEVTLETPTRPLRTRTKTNNNSNRLLRRQKLQNLQVGVVPKEATLETPTRPLRTFDKSSNNSNRLLRRQGLQKNRKP